MKRIVYFGIHTEKNKDWVGRIQLSLKSELHCSFSFQSQQVYFDRWLHIFCHGYGDEVEKQTS